MIFGVHYTSSVAATPKPKKFDIPPKARLFENKRINPILFRITTAISGFQLLVWGYLSYFALTQLESHKESDTKVGQEKDSPTPQHDVKSELKEDKSIGTRTDLYKWFMSSKWRLFLSLLSLGAGTVFGLVAFIYPQRVVRTLTYVRPTQMLEVVTYSPWGVARKIEVPLVDVVCNTTEAQLAQLAKGQNIALKIKDYSLFFLLNPGSTIDPMLRTLVLSRRKV